MDAGVTSLPSAGTHNIKVAIKLDTATSESDRDYESFAVEASIGPLAVIIFFAFTTGMVSCVHFVLLPRSFYVNDAHILRLQPRRIQG